MYSEQFKGHLTNPRNVGELLDANAVGEETNPVCGDRLVLYLRIGKETIEAAQFLAYGCPPTLVCGSALTQMLIGRSIAEAQDISRKDLLDAVGGLPGRKQHAAALAIEALKTALGRDGRNAETRGQGTRERGDAGTRRRGDTEHGNAETRGRGVFELGDSPVSSIVEQEAERRRRGRR